MLEIQDLNKDWGAEGSRWTGAQVQAFIKNVITILVEGINSNEDSINKLEENLTLLDILKDSIKICTIEEYYSEPTHSESVIYICTGTASDTSIESTDTNIESIFVGNRNLWYRNTLINPLISYKSGGILRGRSVFPVSITYSISGTSDIERKTETIEPVNGIFEKEFDSPLSMLIINGTYISHIDTLPVGTNLRALSIDATSVESINFKGMHCQDLNMFQIVEPLQLSELNLQDIGVIRLKTSLHNMFVQRTGRGSSLKSLDLSSIDLTGFKSANAVINATMLPNVETLNVGYWDMGGINAALFTGNEGPTALKKIEGTMVNIKCSISFQYAELGTQTVKMIINGLSTVKEKKTLTISEYSYAMIDQALIDTAIRKGWDVVAAPCK